VDKSSWRLIHLHRIKGVSRKLIWKMLKKDPYLEELYHLSITELVLQYQISLDKATWIKNELQNTSLKKEIYRDAQTYTIITIYHQQYPPSLRCIPDPPLVLYLHGNPSLLKYEPILSVVGTRQPSKYARNVMQKLLIPLARENWLICSGLALGIDGIAHEIAIMEQSPTIAVIGCGLNHIYPKEHVKLFNRISEVGLIVSEYPPNQSPKRYYFPERNRIISGLSFGTLVIEAKQKSGSLITVEQALEQGREVLAVPGSLMNIASEGCHQLIQDGAKLVYSAVDILNEWESSKERWQMLISNDEKIM
jgi:DNA processing protein